MPKPRQLKIYEVEATFEVVTLFEIEAYSEEEAKAQALALLKDGEEGLSAEYNRQVTKVREC